MKKFFKILFISINLFCIYYLINFNLDTYKTKKENALLQNYLANQNIENLTSENYIETEETNIINEPQNENTKINNEIIEESNINNQIVQTERMVKIAELKQQNPDIIGWIEIENTEISYPVLQCSDNEYYMNHNYKKEKSKNGAIFLDKDYNWDLPSSNLLIYGHNMKNNTMFQHLLKYKNKSFFDEHPNIRFTTTNDDKIFEIISVFESRVYYQYEKNVFKYYYFINAENEEQFNNYVQNAKNSSLYDTGKTAIYGEQLMTLSTCSYHTKDGRFVVVAKSK